MSNASVGTLRAQVAKLLKENARLQGEVTKLVTSLAEVNKAHRELTNGVLSGAPECWDKWLGDGDVAVLDYVASLEGQGGGVNGHTEDCRCWS